MSWKTIATIKELAICFVQDILSMGGFWVIDGKTKTGQKIDEMALRNEIEELKKLLLSEKP